MNADISVREVMDREYLGVSESDDLLATVELFLGEGVDTAVVLRGSEPVGVLTCRDVLSMLLDGPDPADATVRDAMTETVPTVPPRTTLAAAAEELSTRDARRLVVTEGDAEPLGVLTEHDVLATRPFGDEIGRPGEGLAIQEGAETALETEERPTPVEGYQEQGICEVCGTFTGDLAAFNGQLVCGDCREM